MYVEVRALQIVEYARSEGHQAPAPHARFRSLARILVSAGASDTIPPGFAADSEGRGWCLVGHSVSFVLFGPACLVEMMVVL